MVLRIQHIIFIPADDNDAIISLAREADVHLVVVHDLADVLAALADEAPVHARVDVYFLAVLVVLE